MTRPANPRVNWPDGFVESCFYPLEARTKGKHLHLPVGLKTKLETRLKDAKHRRLACALLFSCDNPCGLWRVNHAEEARFCGTRPTNIVTALEAMHEIGIFDIEVGDRSTVVWCPTITLHNVTRSSQLPNCRVAITEYADFGPARRFDAILRGTMTLTTTVTPTTTTTAAPEAPLEVVVDVADPHGMQDHARDLSKKHGLPPLTAWDGLEEAVAWFGAERVKAVMAHTAEQAATDADARRNWAFLFKGGCFRMRESKAPAEVVIVTTQDEARTWAERHGQLPGNWRWNAHHEPVADMAPPDGWDWSEKQKCLVKRPEAPYF